MVELVQALGVDLEQLEAAARDVARDPPVVAHLREVAHPPKEPVRDPRRPARAAGDLVRAVVVDPTSRIPAERAHDPAEVLARVVVQPRREPEPLAQRKRDPARARRGADQREPRKLQADAARRGPLAEHDVELEVLQRRVEHLFDRARHPVDLVDEQHVALLEVREDRREIAGPVERGAGRRLEPDAHLVRHDLRRASSCRVPAGRRTTGDPRARRVPARRRSTARAAP